MTNVIPAGPVATLTPEELSFANIAAHRGHKLMAPVTSMAERANRLVIGDQTLRLTDHPMNHAAFGILDAFAHDHAKGQAALWRLLSIFGPVCRDRRFKKFFRDSPDGEVGGEVATALMRAVGEVPCQFGEAINLKNVLALANKFAAEDRR